MLVELTYHLRITAFGYGIFYVSNIGDGTSLIKSTETLQQALDWFSDEYPGTELHVEIKQNYHA